MARIEDDIVRWDWRPNNVLAEVDRRLERGLVAAAMFVRGKVVESLSIGQTIAYSKSGKSVRGLSPSRPGEPPHVLLGRLRQSITHRVFKRAGVWIASVGTNVEYARRLELGFVGTDRLGRNINQAPRPYLRPAIVNNRAQILRLITRAAA